MAYVCDLTPAEISALPLNAGTYEIAPDTYLNISEDGTWSVSNEDGEIEKIGTVRGAIIAYLLDLRASYERVTR
jgi:hypothetical protein